MPFLTIHVINHPDEQSAERLCRFEEMLGILLENQESMMIDVSSILSAARQEASDNASLRALLRSSFAALMKSNADLAVAVAASDPAATVAAQKDIADVVALLNTDHADTQAALAENVLPAAAPAEAAPAADATAADPAQ